MKKEEGKWGGREKEGRKEEIKGKILNMDNAVGPITSHRQQR